MDDLKAGARVEFNPDKKNNPGILDLDGCQKLCKTLT